MAPRTADLHLHSTCSDGALPPAEVIRLAASRGVEFAALTDHDTVDGIPEAQAEAARWGLHLVSGVEVSVDYRGQDIHVLAYHLFPRDPQVLDMLGSIREGRKRRVAEMVAKLQALGVGIGLDQVLAHTDSEAAVGRLHVAVALEEAGVVACLQDAFRYYIGQGGPAYVPKETFSLEATFDVVRNAGGVLVLAHPGVYDLDPIWDDLMSAGLDGLEVWHPVHEPAKVESFRRLAIDHGLVMTGGSDFHGGRTDEVRPGTMPVGVEVVRALEARRPRR